MWGTDLVKLLPYIEDGTQFSGPDILVEFGGFDISSFENPERGHNATADDPLGGTFDVLG